MKNIIALCLFSVFIIGCTSEPTEQLPIGYYEDILKRPNSNNYLFGTLSTGNTIFEGDVIFSSMLHIQGDFPGAFNCVGFYGTPESGVADVLARAPKYINTNPQKIIVCVGIYDAEKIIAGTETVAQFEANLQLLITEYKKTSAQVYFVSALPINSAECLSRYGMTINNATIIDLNSRIQTICAANGYSFIDMWTTFYNGGTDSIYNDSSVAPSLDYSHDGLRLNIPGQTKFIDSLKAVIL